MDDDLLDHYPPRRDQPDIYYWYYGTQTMYHMQGKYWERWNGAIRDLLVSTQEKTGPMAGTWQPRDQWENSGGRLYAEGFCDRHSGLSPSCVHDTDCALRPLWSRLQASVDHALDGVSVADLLNWPYEDPSIVIHSHPRRLVEVP